MPSTPNWKAILEFGSSIAEPRRQQAKEFVTGLVDAGQLGREQAGAAVEEILALGRKRTEELSEVIRREVERQLRSLGITKAGAAKAPAKSAPAAAKKSTAKKAPASKAPAKKAAKAPAKKTAAKKATTAAAAKPVAKATTAKQSAPSKRGTGAAKARSNAAD